MSAQNVELQSLYATLHIKNIKVKRKAEEFLRLLEIRAPGGFKHVHHDSTKNNAHTASKRSCA